MTFLQNVQASFVNESFQRNAIISYGAYFIVLDAHFVLIQSYDSKRSHCTQMNSHSPHLMLPQTLFHLNIDKF
jgi:hypothetical protein